MPVNSSKFDISAFLFYRWICFSAAYIWITFIQGELIEGHHKKKRKFYPRADGLNLGLAVFVFQVIFLYLSGL